MRSFSDYEPLVGEVVGLRTFRVDESGLMLPLYSTLTWYDGPNTATCAPPTGEGCSRAHPVPTAECECGFYAYGTERAAARNRNMRYVQAVVSCWGGVVAGTQGFRAEHARIDAIWLSPKVPPWLRRRVAARYPSAALYADRAAMLAEHPLSVLDCYEPPGRRRIVPTAAAWTASAGLFALGLLPLSVLREAGLVRDVWLATSAVVLVLCGWLLLGARRPGHRAAALLTVGLVAWLIAPAFGLAGWLLRLPVLRAVLVLVGGYLATLRPGFFPVVRSEREKPFCGVSP